MKKEFTVYIGTCGDNTYYTGIAKDVAKRFRQHNAGKGARYTRSRHPIALSYTEGPYTHAKALRRERSIKKLPRAQKTKLILSY